jgi:hypothetical protein
MAKKKTAPPKGLPENRTVIVHLKGSPEYAEWLESIHRKTHIPRTTIMRLALAEWAKANGHPAPPEM